MDLDLIEHDIDTPRRVDSQASRSMQEIETPVKPIKVEDFDLWQFAEQQMSREGKSNCL